jgi:hypothetical protein
MKRIRFSIAHLAAAGLAVLALAATCRAAPAPAAEKAAGEPAAAQPAKESKVETLTAGPIRMKFQDGELRYLYVGQKEIVRRIYFAVRDEKWQTPMPTFSRVDVEKQADHFRIGLEATCKSDTVDYAWTGEIIGRADGEITFRVTGTPAKTFKSNRIGLCVLFGADSLAGQAFEALDADDKATAGQFPDLVLPFTDLVAKDFKTLRYSTDDGLKVSCSLTPVLFSMEDQRNWGDSSYKAYNTILAGAEAVAGKEATVMVTLKAAGAKVAAVKEGPVLISLGKEMAGVKLPEIIRPNQSAPESSFLDLNAKRDSWKDKPEITIGYIPSSHLPDDDTWMENRSAILQQLRTIHSVAPKTKVRFDLIQLTPGADPRAGADFAAAWMVGAMKSLARGGADVACFKVDQGPARDLLMHFKECSSVPDLAILSADVTAAGRSPVEVVAMRAQKRMVVVIANSTAEARKIVVKGFTVGETVRSERVTSPQKDDNDEVLALVDGIALELAPYEVHTLLQGPSIDKPDRVGD